MDGGRSAVTAGKDRLSYGCSAVGSVPDLGSGGRGFDPRHSYLYMRVVEGNGMGIVGNAAQPHTRFRAHASRLVPWHSPNGLGKVAEV